MKISTLVERVGNDAGDKSDADVPDRERAGYNGNKAFPLIIADITSSKRKLSAGEKQDHAKGGRRKKP